MAMHASSAAKPTRCTDAEKRALILAGVLPALLRSDYDFLSKGDPKTQKHSCQSNVTYGMLHTRFKKNQLVSMYVHC